MSLELKKSIYFHAIGTCLLFSTVHIALISYEIKVFKLGNITENPTIVAMFEFMK